MKRAWETEKLWTSVKRWEMAITANLKQPSISPNVASECHLEEHQSALVAEGEVPHFFNFFVHTSTSILDISRYAMPQPINKASWSWHRATCREFSIWEIEGGSIPQQFMKVGVGNWLTNGSAPTVVCTWQALYPSSVYCGCEFPCQLVTVKQKLGLAIIWTLSKWTLREVCISKHINPLEMHPHNGRTMTYVNISNCSRK